MINNLLNRENKTSTINKLIDDKGVTVSRSDLIANSFNNYFSNIAPNLKLLNKGEKEKIILCSVYILHFHTAKSL